MSLNADYQKLEPGSEVRLFEVDGSAFGVGEILRFHAYNIPHTEQEILAATEMKPNFPPKVSGGRGKSTRLAVSD